MSYELNRVILADFEKYRVYEGPHSVFGGMCHRFKFENGYGASVIKHKFSYGFADDLWELAVIKFDDAGGWDLDNTTGIADEPVGGLDDVGVRNLMERIKNLDGSKNGET